MSRRSATSRSLVALALAAGLLGACDLGSDPAEPPARPAPPEAAQDASQNVVPPPRPADDRPNIVMVLVDDMRTDELPYLPRTRALLARHGVRFPHNISPHPLCCPARASLATGSYAQTNGVLHNSGDRGGYQALEPGQTYAPWLQRSGYRTAFVGKFLNDYSHRDPREPGWDVWSAQVGRVSAYRRSRFFGEQVERGYVTTQIERRSNDLVTDLAGKGSPFFLVTNHTAPHVQMEERDNGRYEQLPPPAEPRYARLYDDAADPAFFRKPSFLVPWPGGKTLTREEMRELHLARVRSLASVDDAVASLVRTLRRTGELANTYVVFTSDNGHALGEHGYRTKNYLMREMLDVPLVVRGPGVARGASTAITSLVDLPATFLEIAGVKARHRLDGVSLLPQLRHPQRRPRGWRDTTLVQTGNNRDAGPEPFWGSRGVQTRRYLYGYDPGGTTGNWPEFLFDRERDPYELTNVVDHPAYAGVVAELRRRTAALVDCVGRACNRVFGPDPRPADEPVRAS
ncbi:sulfatase-like hydrolase/transferase [Nocardioides sp. cx-169]|uniref:sulfatase-like hydrolase/transferase n=1 Tax=Nocardioides sp. cx-169 TaxID=2899080 RepID=UPI001E576E95|nr:sulfatase-like hydrolase/transferase [Nocardioides sp. cx-169]MCD4536574.1 sulfatase-like hydrolase/transferase [Nocardioides sp. cx-169]